VRASIPKKSKVFKTEHAYAAEPQKFFSNFHPYTPPTTRKMWVSLSRIPYPNRFEPRARCEGSPGGAIRAYGESGRSAKSNECCSESTVSQKRRAAFRDLHSKVTNTVFNLANTAAAFVLSESRLMAASFGSGEVEALLAGNAPQSRFGALSVPAFVRPCMTSPVGAAFERPAFCRHARASSAFRNRRSGMTSARRRWEGVGTEGCRKV